ncbi:MAG: hypothetical protein M3081_16845, partial [Gemmatimonadota bacterium]|nr:hypothetical protein [Gemmatimonadota bacterium]
MIQAERHTVQAEIALAEHRPQDAITEFTIAAPERSPISTMADLGRAYDIADNADSTIALYERYVSTPDLGRLNNDATLLAGIYKRLGELYDKHNDRPRAIANYRKFVELWASADPELQPKVAAVKQRLATLGDLEKK